ncbi:hypothetical protein VTN00DRAFT_1629 [Thermoascus crustaceus]|uniref:uncharacterized protein n=1 Tax=Thermoascus crustaceus TaxID=5088 RepID=UPI0037443630
MFSKFSTAAPRIASLCHSQSSTGKSATKRPGPFTAGSRLRGRRRKVSRRFFPPCVLPAWGSQRSHPIASVIGLSGEAAPPDFAGLLGPTLRSRSGSRF